MNSNYWLVPAVVLLGLAFTQAFAFESSLSTIEALRGAELPVKDRATIDVHDYRTGATGGGGRFEWRANSTEADDGGTIIMPTATKGAGRWVRLREEKFIDAREYGCVADYEKISCAIAADGHVTQMRDGKTMPFSARDVGKVLIIGGARSWPDYSLDPVPLNATIVSVDPAGVAAVQSMDEKERGSIVANRATTAELFTDNTDAIARALACQAANKLTHVQLPEGGVIGLCPFISQTWKASAYLDNATHTKPVFLMKDGAALKGAGRSRTRLKIGYFGEFEPFKSTGIVPYRYWPIVFLFEPVEGKPTTGFVESLSVEFPFSPVVEAGYSLAADGWNTSPARHALQVTMRDVAVVDPQRNTTLFYSINGGLYTPDNTLLAESKYVIENCDFETGGGCSFKNQNAQNASQNGGKSVYLNNVIFHGGGNIITRHYLDTCTFESAGKDFFLEVSQPGFTWKDFNAHSAQVTGAFNPTCMVRKAFKGKIRTLAPLENGRYTITIDGESPPPVTKSDVTILINFGLGEKQIYLEKVASVTAGSNVITANLSWAVLDAPQMAALVGAPIRVYYEENLVNTVYDIVSPRRIKLDAASAAGKSLLGQKNLDVTVNYEEARGAFGHTFYVGHNVNFYINKMKVYDCAKRSFRVSGGGSNAGAGQHELTDYEVFPSRGMAAMCNLRTEYQAAEEFGGLLKVRRSKVSSVYGVTLDMDDHSIYVAQGGIYGGSVIRNSKVFGMLAGNGPSAMTRIENSEVGLILTRLDEAANRANSKAIDAKTPRLSLENCTGTVTFQNGVVEAKRSAIQIGYEGDAAQYDLWKEAIKGTYIDCKFTAEPTGLHVMTPEQRVDFMKRQTIQSPAR